MTHVLKLIFIFIFRGRRHVRVAHGFRRPRVLPFVEQEGYGGRDRHRGQLADPDKSLVAREGRGRSVSGAGGGGMSIESFTIFAKVANPL